MTWPSQSVLSFFNLFLIFPKLKFNPNSFFFFIWFCLYPENPFLVWSKLHTELKLNQRKSFPSDISKTPFGLVKTETHFFNTSLISDLCSTLFWREPIQGAPISSRLSSHLSLALPHCWLVNADKPGPLFTFVSDVTRRRMRWPLTVWWGHHRNPLEFLIAFTFALFGQWKLSAPLTGRQYRRRDLDSGVWAVKLGGCLSTFSHILILTTHSDLFNVLNKTDWNRCKELKSNVFNWTCGHFRLFV